VNADAAFTPNPPLPGCLDSSQELFLSCPAFEALLEGGRGAGKTVVLLADFAAETGKGYGPYWRGILFRETYPQLEDVKAKSLMLFSDVFPDAVFNEGDYFWRWPDGETLFLRHMKKPADYWNYHGHEYPWIGWEELTNWGTNQCYEMMKKCCRSSFPGIPKRVRSTTNPWGKGHAWVKRYFVDPAPANTPIEDPKTGRHRVRIYAPTEENRPLHEADPAYLLELEGTEDENLRKAWRGKKDRWDISAGAFFADAWNPRRHVLEPFPIPITWKVNRAFDWGSSKPFSVGWYAESDGSEVDVGGGVRRTFPRGSIFRIAEWYGWNGKPNEGCRMLAATIAAGILDREKKMVPSLLSPLTRVAPGPADTSIFDEQNGVCIEADMRLAGVRWERADKSPGSRHHGWERARKMLAEAAKDTPEEPGFYVFSTCRHFLRTIPSLVRDEADPDDIDTEQEDHIADEWRYELLRQKHGMKQRETA
jgi:hypothetical protein